MAPVARELDLGKQLLGRWVAQERPRLEAPEEFAAAETEKSELERPCGFDRNLRGTQGPGALARNGTGVDRKTVAASMRRQGLEGISPRRFRPIEPIGETRIHSVPDLVARKWDTALTRSGSRTSLPAHR